MERGDGLALAKFSSWCPKVIAGIGRLPDTLADRCVVVRMQRKTAKEECERVRLLDAESLRRRCARFVLDHRGEISGATPPMPKSLHDRAADIWEPLFVLADLAGGVWPEKARGAAEALTAAAHVSNPIVSLLLDIYVIFATLKADRQFSRRLASELNRRGTRPWREALKGKDASEGWLAQQLRPYGVLPKTIRIGEERAKGYFHDEFKEIFKRYIPRAEIVELLREDDEGRA